MIFKPRQSLPEEPMLTEEIVEEESEDGESEEKPTRVEMKENEKETGDAVVGAFEAVAQVVSREMESVKRSIAELEIQLTRRLDAEKQSMHSIVNELRQDMIARVDTLRQNQEKALIELSGQSKSSIDGLRTKIEPALDQAIKRAEQMKTGLEQILAAKEHRLEQELQVLSRNISGVRGDLERQVATSGRVSSLLNNMADVFSDSGTLPEEVLQAALQVQDDR